ncbi:MAG: SusC/RagA family TonB-linked outer membrane protein [Bacteroidales bacterium]
MKLTITLMLVFSLNLSATGFGQISFEARDKSIRDVFAMLEEETSYRFFYNDDLITVDKTVDMNVSDLTIDQILERLFESTGLGYKVLENNLIVVTPKNDPLQSMITGRVTDAATGQGMPGVSIVVKGTSFGVNTDLNGYYAVNSTAPEAILTFSFIGYVTQEIAVGGRTKIDVSLVVDLTALEEVVVVGYGTQKKSDITGSVASIPKERLENAPNQNIAQAIQGSIPGVMIQTTSAGANPDAVIMIRGRNSILADNSPLIVVDGIPYSGSISDLNPNDIQSIEVLKDASSAAIYGSRGSNGVILISTKEGIEGKIKISYDGYYSLQRFAFLPDYMDGNEFYDFKMKRFPGAMTQSERDLYESGNWTDWISLGLRNGSTQQHTLSASGGSNNTKFFISGNYLDVKGLAVNDNFKRFTSRINLDTKVLKWLTLGSRTQFSFDDRRGLGPDMSDLFQTNPLTKAYEEDGSQAIYIWDDDHYFGNPLQMTLYDNIDNSHQILSNNYAIVDFPFIKGLSYRINTGVTARFLDEATYIGRNTKIGLEAKGSAETSRSRSNNTVIENILSYNREIGRSKIFGTAVYSYEKNYSSRNSLEANGFPHDFLEWYSSAQATQIVPDYSFNESVLTSQMLRFNYVYDNRYLVTLTGRRDGFSGFGSNSKWGFFPSLALGWNLHNEKFFLPLKEIFNEFKVRVSYGLNGNQAVGPYESISRLGEFNMISNKQTQAGYVPSRLGQENLGWESSKTLNFGLDFGIFNSRVSGNINLFKTNTTDLLLNRSISAVHGITSITQNIGETQNTGIELALQSRNIVTTDFTWATSANFAFTHNEIISLYGELDENGKEIDDVANAWFIGEPIRVNYDFVWEGTWQLDETAEAQEWGTKPGYVKLKDFQADGTLSADDKRIIGQQDPKFIWGISNTFGYKGFKLDIFIHGVQGVTKENTLMTDETWADVRRNTINKNWWTPENPTNEWVVNELFAERMSGILGAIYENASFIRIKDVSLSYTFPKSLLGKYAVNNLRLFATGRNLATFTKWRGLDPELDSQHQIPLQKEFVFGLNLEF